MLHSCCGIRSAVHGAYTAFPCPCQVRFMMCDRPTGTRGSAVSLGKATRCTRSLPVKLLEQQPDLMLLLTALRIHTIHENGWCIGKALSMEGSSWRPLNGPLHGPDQANQVSRDPRSKTLCDLLPQFAGAAAENHTGSGGLVRTGDAELGWAKSAAAQFDTYSALATPYSRAELLEAKKLQQLLHSGSFDPRFTIQLLTHPHNAG